MSNTDTTSQMAEVCPQQEDYRDQCSSTHIEQHLSPSKCHLPLCCQPARRNASPQGAPMPRQLRAWSLTQSWVETSSWPPPPPAGGSTRSKRTTMTFHLQVSGTMLSDEVTEEWCFGLRSADDDNDWLHEIILLCSTSPLCSCSEKYKLKLELVISRRDR